MARASPKASSRAIFSRLAALVATGLACVAVAPAHAQDGQVPAVRIPYEGGDGTLTPYTFTRAYGLMTLVYDTLLWRDERGVPRPWLARSVQTSADGRRLTVRLARGARWHDGADLTAADVAFTLRYVLAHEHPRFTPQLRAFAGVDVVSRHRLVIRLRHRAPGFLDQPLADLPILPRHIWSRLAAGRSSPSGRAIGSGPYRLVRRRRDGGYRLEASARYFRGRPAVRVIDLPVVRAGDVAQAFEREDVDLVALRALIGPVGLLESRGIGIARGTSYRGRVLMFNLRRAPFDSPALRRAVAQSLHLPRIARRAAGSGAVIVPAERGYVHPGSRWAPREDLHAFDPAAARRVLAGRSLRVLASRDEPRELLAAGEIVASLRRAGARARLVARSDEQIARAVGQDHERPDFDLALWSLYPLASYDPDFLRGVFGAGSRLNYGGYRSAAFERLADRVARSPSVRARRAAAHAQLRLLARDLPVVPLFFGEGLFAFRRAVYDRWVYVSGSGVLDKRSFVAGSTRNVPPAATAPAGAADGTSIGVPGLIALGLLALALLVIVVGSMRSRR